MDAAAPARFAADAPAPPAAPPTPPGAPTAPPGAPADSPASLGSQRPAQYDALATPWSRQPLLDIDVPRARDAAAGIPPPRPHGGTPHAPWDGQPLPVPRPVWLPVQRG